MTFIPPRAGFKMVVEDGLEVPVCLKCGNVMVNDVKRPGHYWCPKCDGD